MSSLGDEVFIVRFGRSEIDVYDVDTFTFRRTLQVNMYAVSDIASCTRNNCLYLCGNRGLCRIGWNSEATNWMVNGMLRSLSVAPATSHVVATWTTSHIIKEYAPSGCLVREIHIELEPTANLLHAVLLASGQFLVSHKGDHEHAICLTGDDGIVAQKFSTPPGWDVGRMNFPAHVVVDKQGFVLVADSNNHRILLLSPSLAYVRVLISSLGNRRPSRLHLDEVHGRLYVGYHLGAGGRVSVYEVKQLCQY